jgi:hypothetical protein
METRKDKEAPYLRDAPSIGSPEFIKEYYRKQQEAFENKDNEQEQ